LGRPAPPAAPAPKNLPEKIARAFTSSSDAALPQQDEEVTA
jgi:hypothetical protein